MDVGRGRQRAYSDLLTGLIDLGPTTAADRFDELLEQAREDGRIDDDTARVLKWWQREAVRAQGDHLLTTAPALLAALDEAQSDAIESAAAAQSAWTTAVATPPAPSPAPAPAPAEMKARASGARHAAPPDAPSPTAVAPAGRSDIPGLDAPADTPLFDQVVAVRDAPPSVNAAASASAPAPAPAQAPAPAPAPAVVSTLVTAPIADGASPAPESEQPNAQVLDSAAPARRRRLLVAGLTVISDGNPLSSIADPP